MNKQLLTTTLFSMLVVSCAGAPSLNSSTSISPSITSSNTQIPTTSSPSFSSSSSNSSSSTTIVATSNSSSSTSYSSSSSSSTSSSSSSSTTPTNNKKVPFNQIGSLVAQVVDAKALGVSNTKDNVRPVNARRNAQADEVDTEDQNKMVKVTEIYNPTTKVAEDKTIEVTFARTTTTVINELQTGFETYVATAEDITIERLTDEPGHVVIKNVPNYEFRALNGDIPLQEGWVSSNQETIEFLFTKLESGTFTKVATAPALDIDSLILPDSPVGEFKLTNNPNYEFRLMNGETELSPWTKYETETITFIFDTALTPTIEARGIDATIMIESIQGLTYAVTIEGEPILSDVTDNGSLDEDITTGKITLSGLKEGFTYDVAFDGQVPDVALTDITIEARSKDASISFTTFEDFTYEVKQGDLLLYTNITDNNLVDLNPKEGVVEVKGLTEGLPYDVHYSGYRLVERITQDEVDGQVDKLYVLYQYTFISFVPLTLNPRPEASLLEKDYDDVAIYDKTDYYSDSTRQSFVVDNDTGFIYKIENINIANLSGGCVSVKDNSYPFDMRITNQGELQFFTLYQNPAIITNSCIKDRYGNKFINNNRLNIFDEATNTQYYVSNYLHTNLGLPNSDQYGQEFAYFLTSLGEVVRTGFGAYQHLKYRLLDKNREPNLLVGKKDYEIYVSYLTNSIIEKKTLYKSGAIYVYNSINKRYFHKDKITNENIFFNFNSNLSNDQMVIIHNENNEVYFPLSLYSSLFSSNYPQREVDTVKFLADYNILLFHSDGKVFYYKNFWESYFNAIDIILSSSETSSWNWQGLTFYWLNNLVNFPMIKHLFETNKVNIPILNESTIDTNVWGGKITKVGLQGNTTYELIPEFKDGEWVITPYVSGTYVAPPAATITFQPINK